MNRFLGELKIPLSNIGPEDNCEDSWYLLQNVVSATNDLKSESSLDKEMYALIDWCLIY